MSQKVGYGFNPNDEEVICYLLLKERGCDSEVDDVIAEVDILQYDPWQLPELSAPNSNGTVWYFSCKVSYRSSKLVKRTTGSGYWKITGKDQKVYSSDTGEQIGLKKILTYYTGRAPNIKKTNWVIHEYHLTNQGAYVICRLKKKADKKADNSTTPDESELNCQGPFDDGNNSTTPRESESSCQGPFGDGNITENTSPEENPFLPSNMEPVFENGWPYFDSPSTLQSQMVTEQGQNLPSTKGFCESLNGLQYSVDSTHSSEQVVDPFEETVHTHQNNSSPSTMQSQMVYLENEGPYYDSPTTLQSQMVMEESQNLPFTKGFCESFHGLQSYVESSEQVVDPFEEAVHTHRNGYSPSTMQSQMVNFENGGPYYDSPATLQSQMVNFENGGPYYDSPPTKQSQMVYLENGGPYYDSPATLQSQMVTEESHNLPFTKGSCESFHGLQYYVDSSELVVDPFEEAVHAHRNSSSPSTMQSQMVNFENGGPYYDSPATLQSQMVNFGNGGPYYDSPATLQSQMVMEESQNLPFTKGFCESFNRLQYCVDSTEQVVDPFEETIHTHHNGFSPSMMQSQMAYFEDGIDTNAETIHAQVKIYSPIAGEHISPIA